MQRVNWEKYRLGNAINLVAAYTDLYGKPNPKVRNYLREVVSLYPIKSRQAAAMTIASARILLEDRPL